MTSELPPSEPTLSLDSARQIDRLCDAFEKTWIAGSRPIIEDYLLGTSDDLRRELLRELIQIDVFYRRRIGENPAAHDYHGRFAEIDTGWLETLIAAAGRSRRGGEQSSGATDGLTRELTSPLATNGRIGTIRYFGDYELLEEIARGGMGVVFKARQATLNRIVAVKMILSGQLATQADVERFHAEAEAAANLDHPGIVPIFEVGEHQGQHYFSMGFVEGRSLSAQIAEGPIPPRQAAELVRTVCEAVQFAHEHQVIHRDLKPANILLDRDGRPRVTDFGLAKRVQDESGLTATGQVLGTPSFMPPEQAAGKLDLVGRASDVYSLGAVLYTLLTGRPPFQSASSVDTLRQVLEQEPIAPRVLNSDLPRDLETIVLKCLEKSIPRRYASAQELADELKRFVDDRPILARPVSRTERAWRWCRRNPVVASLVAAVAASLVIGAAVSLFFALESSQRADANLALAGKEQSARNLAESQQKLAEANARTARHRLYLANMLLAKNAWDENHVGVTLDLLNRASPLAGEEDLRGFEWRYLNRLCHRNYLNITTESVIDSVCFSPNGKLLAIASGAAVELWDPSDGRKIATCHGDGDDFFIHSVVFSSDGSRVAASTSDRGIFLWDSSTGQQVTCLKWGGDIQCVAFSPDGKRLASGDEIGEITFWDLSTNLATMRANAGDREYVWSIAFSPDGLRLASGSNSAGLQIWDTSTGQKVATLEGHRGPVISVAYSPDGKRIASTSEDMTIKLWDVATQRVTTTIHQPGGVQVSKIAFSPEGNRLAASGEQLVRIWGVDHGTESMTLRAHDDQVESVAFSPDGKRLASASGFNTVKLWDLAMDPEMMTLAAHDTEASAVAFSPNGKLLASAHYFKATSHRDIKLWDIATGQEKLTFDTEINGKGWGTWDFCRMAFRPDGTQIATASTNDFPINLWDVATGKKHKWLHLPEAGAQSIAFSPNGKLFAVLGNGNKQKIWLWEVSSERLIATLDVGRTECLAFSPDSAYLAYGIHQTIAIWDIVGARRKMSLPGHGDTVWKVEFSPDGTRLASASFDGTIKVWNMRDGHEEMTLKGHGPGELSICFSPDGKRLASASADQSIKLWDLAIGQEIMTLKDQINGKSVVFSPDGNRLAATCNDGSVKVWDGRPIAKQIYGPGAGESVGSNR